VTEQQIDIGELAEEMNREPLPAALFENAQLRILLRKALARVAALEGQHESPQS
jgi:hypothetical protein